MKSQEYVNTLFRQLKGSEENEFRQWARDNYVPGEPINEIWHPVVREECEQMNREHSEREES